MELILVVLPQHGEKKWDDIKRWFKDQDFTLLAFMSEKMTPEAVTKLSEETGIQSLKDNEGALTAGETCFLVYHHEHAEYIAKQELPDHYRSMALVFSIQELIPFFSRNLSS
jgi:hypothetical protein